MTASQAFLAAGGAVLLLLGAGHGVLMLRDLRVPRAFVPVSDDLRRRMEGAPIGLARNTDLWRAWVGFNLSHSLGMVVAGGTTIYLAARHHSLYADSPLLIAAPIVVAVLYVVLAWRYWFWGPVAGTAVAVLSFVLAAVTAR